MSRHGYLKEGKTDLGPKRKVLEGEVTKIETSVMSENWQESRSSDLPRKEQDLSQSPVRAALGLLEGTDRDRRGRWGEGCFGLGRRLARH